MIPDDVHTLDLESASPPPPLPKQSPPPQQQQQPKGIASPMLMEQKHMKGGPKENEKSVHMHVRHQVQEPLLPVQSPPPAKAVKAAQIAYFLPDDLNGVFRAFHIDGVCLTQCSIAMTDDERKKVPLSEERKQMLERYLDPSMKHKALISMFQVNASTMNSHCYITIFNSAGMIMSLVHVPLPSQEWTVESLLRVVQHTNHPDMEYSFTFHTDETTTLYSRVKSRDEERRFFEQGRVIRHVRYDSSVTRTAGNEQVGGGGSQASSSSSSYLPSSCIMS